MTSPDHRSAAVVSDRTGLAQAAVRVVPCAGQRRARLHPGGVEAEPAPARRPMGTPNP